MTEQEVLAALEAIRDYHAGELHQSNTGNIVMLLEAVLDGAKTETGELVASFARRQR